MAAVAEDGDGDHVIEVVSAGALYRRAEWERKYWSCSRGKDRYPYPVGYQTIRHFFGISYTMEIQEGPRGPVFLVTSTEGDSANGPTPDIAWKNFEKKSGAKVRNWKRKRSFPQKIDGAELFGFKNAYVQRLLRELIIASTGAVVVKLPHPVTADAASPSSNKDTTDVCHAEGRAAKRSMKPSPTESAAKRVHYQDIFASVGNCSASSQGNANEVVRLVETENGDSEVLTKLVKITQTNEFKQLSESFGRSQSGGAASVFLRGVSDSICLSPLLNEVPDYSKYIVEDSLEESSQSSSQQVDFSSGSYLSSEKNDLEAAKKEAARHMIPTLLPQAIPLLKKSKKKKKESKQKKNVNFTDSVRKASAHKLSDDCCNGVTASTTIDKGTNINSSEMYFHGVSLCDMVKDGSTNDDCTKDESAVELDEMKYFVEDSFEEDPHIWGDNTSKPRGVHYHESGDACSREPNENSRDDDCTKDESVVELDEMKDFVEDSFEADAHIWGDNTSKPRGVHHHESDDACSREPNKNSKNEDCTKDESVDFVEDSFEKDAHICSDNISKPRGVRHHESDDACSREPNKNSKVLDGEIQGHAEPFECQIAVQDSTETPDVVYDHEKGQYILSDAYLAFLEEEFGGEEYPENYHQCNSNVEQMQIEQQFKDPTNSMTVGSSVSLHVPCHKSIDNVDVCTQAQCRYGNGNTIMSASCESNVCEYVHPKAQHNVSLHQHDHAFSSRLGHRLELAGCYLHPMPVLSVMLNTKNHSNLNICVLSGFPKSCQRFLYIYKVTPKDQQDAPPCFVGYTPLLLPSSEQSSTGNFTFGLSGLQLTTDGQVLVLMSSIRIPFCSTQNIDCSCCLCKSQRHEDNSLKIVSVNFGFVSLMTKLMPYRTVSCILICEPNYIVAAEDNRNLHIWKMVIGWSRISEDYVIPSLAHVGPSILELRRVSRNSSLIIGHDGAGGFCLWDISRRTLLATFAAPGNIIFQILPVSFCSLQEDIIHAPVDDIEKRLRDITVSDVSRRNDGESFLMAQREDIAVWALISSASVAEYQHDLRAKEHNARWRLALLAKKRIIMGNILDSRATAVDTSGNYGFAGTYGGLLYMWELSSGRKLAGTQCTKGGRVSCVAVDAESGAVAVADDGCQLLLYTHKKMLSDAGGR